MFCVQDAGASHLHGEHIAMGVDAEFRHRLKRQTGMHRWWGGGRGVEHEDESANKIIKFNKIK